MSGCPALLGIRFPRVSGGDPTQTYYAIYGEKFSPRKRG